MSSERTAIVHQFKFEDTVKHENADSLRIWRVPGTEYTYVLNQNEWSGYHGKVVFVEPDNIIPLSNPVFATFADMTKNGRVKAKKLRGIQSYGILARLPDEGFEAGENVYEKLGIVHYEPQEAGEKSGPNSGECAESPSGDFPKYDVENFMKYARKVFTEGEPCWVTEKIHGSNSCYVYKNDRMNCRSRNLWKREFTSKPEVNLEELRTKGVAEENIERVRLKMENWTPAKNTWWKVLDRTPELREFCRANEGVAVYGEIYGANPGFKYDSIGGESNMLFRAFDVLKDGRWLDAPEAYDMLHLWNVPYVPLLEQNIPFNFDELVKLSQGQSYLNESHIREGIVFKPLKERWSKEVGRVMLKAVSPAYLEKY